MVGAQRRLMNNEFAVAMAVAILGSVAGDFLVKKAAGRSRPRLVLNVAGTEGEYSTSAASPDRIADSPATSTKSYRLTRHWLRLLQLVVGLVLLMLHFGGFLLALKLAPVTVAIPLMSCTYILTTFMGKIFLHERIDRTRWTGIGVIMIGVILLELSTRL